jgi:hypothetical protein
VCHPKRAQCTCKWTLRLNHICFDVWDGTIPVGLTLGSTGSEYYLWHNTSEIRPAGKYRVAEGAKWTMSQVSPPTPSSGSNMFITSVWMWGITHLQFTTQDDQDPTPSHPLNSTPCAEGGAGGRPGRGEMDDVTSVPPHTFKWVQHVYHICLDVGHHSPSIYNPR